MQYLFLGTWEPKLRTTQLMQLTAKQLVLNANVRRLRAAFTDEGRLEAGETWVNWKNSRRTWRTLRNYGVIIFCNKPRTRNQGRPSKADKLD